jgi:hypothetical protein
VAVARRVLSAALRGAGCAQELVDRVVLVGSELVTNAVVHGSGAPTLRLSAFPEGARIEVYDDAPALPAQPARDDTLPSGRGMLIVERSASSWGTEPEGTGKWVWAEFSRPVRRPASQAAAETRCWRPARSASASGTFEPVRRTAPA